MSLSTHDLHRERAQGGGEIAVEGDNDGESRVDVCVRKDVCAEGG